MNKSIAQLNKSVNLSMDRENDDINKLHKIKENIEKVH